MATTNNNGAETMTRTEINARLETIFAELDSLPRTRIGQAADPRRAELWAEIAELQEALDATEEAVPLG